MFAAVRLLHGRFVLIRLHSASQGKQFKLAASGDGIPIGLPASPSPHELPQWRCAGVSPTRPVWRWRAAGLVRLLLVLARVALRFVRFRRRLGSRRAIAASVLSVVCLVRRQGRAWHFGWRHEAVVLAARRERPKAPRDLVPGESAGERRRQGDSGTPSASTTAFSSRHYRELLVFSAASTPSASTTALSSRHYRELLVFSAASRNAREEQAASPSWHRRWCWTCNACEQFGPAASLAAAS